MTQIVEALGPHLKLDLYGCAPEVAASIEEVYEYLDRAPQRLEMTKIMPPYVFKYKPLPGYEDAGVSGFVIIAESHIAVHTWPEKRFISVDLFSCKMFDVERAVADASRHFRATRYQQNLTQRGLEFPRNIPVVQGYMEQERQAYHDENLTKI
jgi:S-adenosylmethionine decarboxylase